MLTDPKGTAMNAQPAPSSPRRPRRLWAAGATSALAAALLAGGGVAVALQANGTQASPAAAAAGHTAASQGGGSQESLASLTALDGVADDVAAVDAAGPGAPTAELAAIVAPAAAATPSPSPSAGARGAASSAKQPARVALRRALAVVIRQDGTAQYGQHAQAAARAAINRYPAAFRRLPEKLRQDLWTLAGAVAGQEAADAQSIKGHALDGTYGAAVQKVAQAIQKAPAKAAPASPSSPASPSPSPTPSSGS